MAITKIGTPELFDFSATNTALQLPTGTTAERPAAPVAGEWRYNTTLSYVEFYDGGAWRQIDTEASAIDPSENFNAVVYNGTGVSGHSITGVGFQPDMVWVKATDAAYDPVLASIANTQDYYLTTSETYIESEGNGRFSSFNTDGFTVTDGTSGSNPAVINNQASTNYVSWNWKAGGAAVLNEEGTTDSQVSANVNAGFSIVSYTGNGSPGSVGHSLGVIPELIIAKNLDGTNAWVVRLNVLGNGYLQLNDTAEYSTTVLWGTPTASVFNFTHAANGETLNDRYIAYCFASIAGYSKIGTYTGTNAPNNITVTGFRPAYLMIKLTDALNGDWIIFDNKRNPSNPLTDVLKANTSGIETTEAALNISFLSNGFSLNGAAGVGGTGQINSLGDTYLYLAIAEEAYNANAVTANQTNPFNDGSQTAQYEFEDNANDSEPNGYIGQGGTFNGSTSGISVSTQPVPNGATSLSFWYNGNGNSGTQYILGNGISTVSKGITVYYTSNTFGALVAKGVSALAGSATGTNIYSNSEWHHIVFTWDGTANSNAFKVYVNGVFEVQGTSDTASATIGTYTSFAMGALSGGVYAAGRLDQVRIYNTVLNPNDVWLLYSETSATSSTLDYPASTGALALYELSGNANDTGTTYNGTDTDVAWVPLYDGAATGVTYATPSVSAAFLKAAVFSGSSSYITTPVDFSTFTDYSVSMWIYPTATGAGTATGTGFGGTVDAGTDDGFFLSINSSNQIRFYERTGSPVTTLTSSNAVTLNTWNNIVAIRNGSTNFIYVNNTVTSEPNSTITHTSDFIFGRAGLYASDSYTGNIDQGRIFNRAIDAGEVTQLYNEPNN